LQSHGFHSEPLPPPTDAESRAHLDAAIAALGDSPETVITRHFMRLGTCEVLVVGDPADLEALIVQADDIAEEPTVYGTSAGAIASLIPHLQGWTCINVPRDLADELVTPVAEAAEASGVRMLDDVFHVLHAPIAMPDVNGARMLTIYDRALIASASELVGDAADRLLDTLAWGHVAGVEHDGALISLCHTFAISERYADLGVVTHPSHRGQGLATAVGALVAQAVQADGRVPVWSTGVTNLASIRTALRLGFEEVSRRAYLIPDFGDD
jgi:RimJ/RimL family protein N-acetyltransferase